MYPQHSGRGEDRDCTSLQRERGGERGPTEVMIPASHLGNVTSALQAANGTTVSKQIQQK